jgi:uncharacterized membrane protein YeaQ/YmgE (transglycosylase-associated protein family)
VHTDGYKLDISTDPPLAVRYSLGETMNFIIWLIAGAFIGWLASVIMKTNARQGLIIDIVVGVVGAFLAGYFLTPFFGVSTINQSNFSLPALLVSLLGAVILLALVRVFNQISRRA